jgi:hypothetical protein
MNLSLENQESQGRNVEQSTCSAKPDSNHKFLISDIAKINYLLISPNIKFHQTQQIKSL